MYAIRSYYEVVRCRTEITLRQTEWREDVLLNVRLPRIAGDLLETMGIFFGKMRGGLGISVCIVGALLAASTGIVGATA